MAYNEEKMTSPMIYIRSLGFQFSTNITKTIYWVKTSLSTN